ncbi:hypothetical protein G3I76_66350, partial [Streptomyces sp. SID11233]|nr:hypothetical protein [Streptomyces sp. SID11233]
IPLTGMAMPFLAQGGSSVVTNWVIVALLLLMSDRAARVGDVRDTGGARPEDVRAAGGARPGDVRGGA